MFKIFAIIIVTLNGQSIGEPAKVTNKVTFASEAECKSFEVSEKNQTAIEMLKSSLETRLQPGLVPIITTVCEQAADDGSI